MNRFLKYFILFLLGIILYYILNKQERFSIGIPIYRRNDESGLLEIVPEDEEVDVDSTILLEEETANHLNTIWPNHSVIDIIFNELKGWGEFQKDEGMDDILLYLPPYVLDESENRFDPIENYMDLSEDEINEDYPDRIILTPKALENIQTDPNWKPEMSRALVTLYEGTGHIITLEDLLKFLPHYILNESENRFDHIENYMNLSEDEIREKYPNRIILIPQALDNIRTDPNWKPEMLKVLEASYGGSDHIITLKDLSKIILKILPHYVLNESENRFDHIENYMNLSEDVIRKKYPNSIILTPQALDNIQRDPFWKEPKILKALEALYGGSYHTVTLEDLPTYTIQYHVEHVEINPAAFPTELPYQIVEGVGDLQLNVNPEVLLRINCALTEVIRLVLVPVGDINEIIRILKESFEFLTQFSDRGLSFANDTFMNWVFGFDDCKTGDDMDTEEPSIVDLFLNKFRKKLREIVSNTFDYYVCASGLISSEYISELHRRILFEKGDRDSLGDWLLKSNQWFNTIVHLHEKNYSTILSDILKRHDISITDDELDDLSEIMRNIDYNVCNWYARLAVYTNREINTENIRSLIQILREKSKSELSELALIKHI